MVRVGFDLDGVVADFRMAFLDVAAKILGRDAIQRPTSPMPDFDAVSAADAKRVWKVITETPNWWVGLAPYSPRKSRGYTISREAIAGKSRS